MDKFNPFLEMEPDTNLANMTDEELDKAVDKMGPALESLKNQSSPQKKSSTTFAESFVDLVIQRNPHLSDDPETRKVVEEMIDELI